MKLSSGALLTIAGSDPSGGAGIQADLKTAVTIGVYGAAAITSLTVQNTERVFSANPVDPALVGEQVEKVLADLPITHIKSGMLGSVEITETVGNILGRFKGVIVCDPVLQSSSGAPLLAGASIPDLRKNILAHATAVTPNFSELEALSGGRLSDGKEIRDAVESLFSDHPLLEVVVVKGGHRNEFSNEINDSLFHKQGRQIIESNSTRKRITTENTHGTGCTFATALSSYHLLTGDWEQSFRLAGQYVQQLLVASASFTMGHGTGPLHHHLYGTAQAEL